MEPQSRSLGMEALCAAYPRVLQGSVFCIATVVKCVDKWKSSKKTWFSCHLNKFFAIPFTKYFSELINRFFLHYFKRYTLGILFKIFFSFFLLIYVPVNVHHCFCHSFVIVLNFSHFCLIPQNHWVKLNQSWHKASLGKGDSNLLTCRGVIVVIVKVHWRNLNVFFSRTNRPLIISTKLGTEHPQVKGTQVFTINEHSLLRRRCFFFSLKSALWS